MDSLEFADLNEVFGSVYRGMKTFDNVLIYVNQAFDIRRSNLSAHYGFWSTYLSLGLIYAKKSD
jgi:hypothetical protein